MIAQTLDRGIRGIVLDAVGTLIEPRPSVAAAYAGAARRQGVELDPAVVRARFRRHFNRDERDERRGPLATDEALEYRRWRRIVTGVLPEVPDPDRAFEELWDHFARPESWAVFDDVRQAAAGLEAAGIAVRVASNFDARLYRVLSGLPAIAHLAAGAVISSEVGYRKPHPAFYQAACRSLGLPPNQVLCVGDDVENDVHGPRRAGLHALLLDRGGWAPNTLPRLRDPRHLPRLLQRSVGAPDGG